MIDGSTQIHQHAQGLAGRVLRLEHDFPRLADHSQTGNRFFRRKLGAAAVNYRDIFFFEFVQPIKNRVEISMHEAEESPAHEISEARKVNQRDGKKEKIAGLQLGFASLRQYAAVKQFVE